MDNQCNLTIQIGEDMYQSNKQSLLMKTIQVIMQKIYIIFNNSNKNNYKLYKALKKQITHFHFSSQSKIICFSDMHLGNKYCNPQYIQQIITKENPDGIFLLGDTFDEERYAKNLFDKLNVVEKEIIKFLYNFTHKSNKILGLIKGDHDNWLTLNNPLGVKPVEKVLLSLGNKKIIITHGDEYDIHKQTDSNFLKIIIEPIFYLLQWLTKSRHNQTAKNILNWTAKHPIFQKIIKIAKYLACNDAYELSAIAVLIGHFHKKYKYKSLRKRNIIRFRILDGTIEKPKQYAVLKIKRNDKLSIRIKTFHQIKIKQKG